MAKTQLGGSRIELFDYQWLILSLLNMRPLLVSQTRLHLMIFFYCLKTQYVGFSTQVLVLKDKFVFQATTCVRTSCFCDLQHHIKHDKLLHISHSCCLSNTVEFAKTVCLKQICIRSFNSLSNPRVCVCFMVLYSSFLPNSSQLELRKLSASPSRISVFTCVSIVVKNSTFPLYRFRTRKISQEFVAVQVSQSDDTVSYRIPKSIQKNLSSLLLLWLLANNVT